MDSINTAKSFDADLVLVSGSFGNVLSGIGSNLIYIKEKEGTTPKGGAVLVSIFEWVSGKRELKPYQWYVILKSFTNASTIIYTEPISYKKAAIYNANNNNDWAYVNISERHDFYQWADKQISSKCKWFGAAEIVTRWNAVGAADNINFWWLTDNAEDFLQQGNKYLFKYNLDNYKKIKNNLQLNNFIDSNGENITFINKKQKTLDYALVQFEQTKVRDFIEKYKIDFPNKNMNDIMNSINYSMTALLAPNEVKKVMNDNFDSDKGQQTFDFKNYNARKLLGFKILDQLYK